MLEIKIKDKKQITKTYSKVWYEITSDVPLTLERIQHLRSAGFIGMGKEWFQHDDDNAPINLHKKIIEDRIDEDIL